MHLVHVIPITRGFGAETLSYFSASLFPAGSLISITLRRKTVPALVLSSEKAEDAKTKVKTAGFALRKIEPQQASFLLSPAFISAVWKTADYAASPLGNVLAAIVPKDLLANAHAFAHPAGKNRGVKTDPVSGELLGERLVLSQPTKDRYDAYRSLIREEFARGSSVFFMIPTFVHAEHAHALLCKGIERYAYVLHSALSKKERLSRLSKLSQTPHPVLVIGTGSFLALPRMDIRTVIIEKETSAAYRSPARPYVDMRMLAEQFAHAGRARLIVADFPLRIETLIRYRRGEFDELAPVSGRSIGAADYRILDIRTKKTALMPHKPKKEFRTIHPRAEKHIEAALSKRTNVFLFVARRGTSATTVCDDCGSILSCEHCGASVVLHLAPSGNVFLCHTCGLARRASTLCGTCGGWRLTPLGVGVERVEAEVKKRFSSALCIRIDKDATKNHAEARKACDRFYETSGNILLGTEMALPYLLSAPPQGGKVPLGVCVVVSFDSLLSLPLWNLSERLLSILCTLAEATTGTVLIQTRRPDYLLFTHLSGGTLMDAYRDEITEREALGYPPFNVLITFSALGSLQSVRKEMENLKKYFHDKPFFAYAAPIQVRKGVYRAVGLLKVPRGEWPDTDLLSRIRQLPPAITVLVDPENLLGT